MIETTRGPMEESALEKTEGVIDGERSFVRWTEFRVPGTTEAYRRESGFDKVNHFAGWAPDEVPCDLGDGQGILPMSARFLDRSVTQVDNDNEFTSVIEYRRKTDGKIVHRSVDVKLKKPPETSGTGSAGNLNSGPRKPIAEVASEVSAIAAEHSERVRKDLTRTCQEICRVTADALTAAGHLNVPITVNWDSAKFAFEVIIRQ